MNYFAPKSAAERYAKGRPYVHPQVIGMIKAFLALDRPLPCAIDLACGTGLSSVALKEIAEQVVGADLSAPMVTLAPRNPRLDYLVAPVEKLPLPDHIFDLMTLSSAFHWVDRAAFFAEARRVLKPGAWLVIYDNSFWGEMQENQAFQLWAREQFLNRYPTPPRAPVAFEQDTLKDGFQLAGREQYQNLVEFSPASLVDYLVTQSNVIAAVEGGQQKIEDIRKWLTDDTTPFFSGRPSASFLFGGTIWYLRHA